MHARLYFALSLVGLVATWIFNIRFMQQTGFAFDVAEFIRQGFANHASSSLAADIGVVFLAFAVFVVAESRRLGMRHGWLYIVLGLGVAAAFAFPLFLGMRERHLQQVAAAAPSHRAPRHRGRNGATVKQQGTTGNRRATPSATR